jgi:putative hydrolase of the HAD superfamily
MNPDTRAPQTLLVDADDTLWENNIYFERVIADFISLLDHQTHTPAEVREHLNRFEHQTIAAHGYGTRSFRLSLIACFEALSGSAVSHQHLERITAFADSIADHEIELLPGVAETLPQLAQRHRLILVTKGNLEEQHDKLERSGLRAHFSAIEVPREKNDEIYRELITRYELDPRNSWMIGNSPKSDINPALAAGLNAVFVAHDFTWVLEHAELKPPPVGQKLLELNGFGKLLEHF